MHLQPVLLHRKCVLVFVYLVWCTSLCVFTVIYYFADDVRKPADGGVFQENQSTENVAVGCRAAFKFTVPIVFICDLHDVDMDLTSNKLENKNFPVHTGHLCFMRFYLTSAKFN